MEQGQALGATPQVTALQTPPLFGAGLVGVFVISALICTAFGQHTADVTWLLQVAERVLSGEQLYTEVRESNPPFSIALYVPFAALENLTGISAHIWTSLGLYALLALSLSLINSILRQVPDLSDHQRRWILLGTALISTVALPLQFAQREHFGIIAALPLLFLISARLGTDDRPPLRLALLIGGLAAILILVKPLYALGLGLPVLCLIWKKRTLRPAVSPDLLTVAAISLAYAAIVLFVFPVYLTDIAPILVDVYVSYRRDLGAMLGLLVFPVFVPAALTVFVGTKPFQMRPETQVFLLASIGFAIAFLISGKGWLYHLYPAIVCAFIALLTQIATHSAPRPKQIGILLAGLASLTFTALSDLHQAGQDVTLPPAVKTLQPQPRLAVITLNIAFGAPLAERLNADWQERDHSDYIGGLALAQRAEVTGPRRDRFDAYIQAEIDRKVDYLMTAPVDLIVLDKASQFWVDRVLADPRIASYLTAYEAIADTDQAVFLVRRALQN
ncbi:MAG: hypothetical protein AAGB16_07020 [Pseudomonadota bacterium]